MAGRRKNTVVKVDTAGAPQPEKKNKENVIKDLTELLKSKGIVVRREKLRCGPGWRAISGSCRLQNDRYVFVDPRLSPEEQLLFLVSKARQIGIADEDLPASAAA